ncbi:hypothetical protein [Nocardia sp. NPDC057668]|uniref:hypothetical protein n=1 Tax=Nocardia sp. NPDC057668 TaxID=3346202 RepID=UPI0036711C04
MGTLISEFDTLGGDLGFDSLPWELRADGVPDRVAGTARVLAFERRAPRVPAHALARPRASRAHLIARRARGAHPLNRVQRAQIGFAALAVSALLTAVAVAGLVGLAQLRAGEFGAETVPVVEVVPAPGPAR